MIKNFITLISIFFLFIFLPACQVSGYKDIEKISQTGNYTLTIEEIDKLLLTEKNGYYQTLALLNRSEAYYQLGLTALERGNTNLAIRLLYISNSDEADEKIIEAYEKRIEEFNNLSQIDNILAVYTYIINNLYESPRIPEYLFKRMELTLNHYNNSVKVWEDFVTLNDNFPESEYIQPSSNIVNTFISTKIDSIFNQKENHEEISNLVDDLLFIRNYPTAFENYINERIADIYVFHAERLIKEKKYIQAEENFRIALKYDESERDYIEKRLNDVCDLFIVEGDNYLKNKEIDLAIRSYRRSFRIISDYAKAIRAIQNAEQRREDIKQAQLLYSEAQQLQRAKELEQALKIYRQANSLDPMDIYQKAISEVINLIEIEKDPQGFALKIIKEHQNGKILKAVEALRNELYGI